jgi:AbrB family looped-hinge helix DNA binding protein
MGHTSTISSKGQMVIPAELRKEMGLKAGVRVNVVRNGNQLIVSPRNLDAVLALCGKYAGMGLEETLLEETRKEREREDKQLEAF